MADLGGGLEFLGCESSTPSTDLASFSDESVLAAEETAEQVLKYIQPSLHTEESRRNVIEYIQRLLKTQLDCEVFPYGSVPLKTYLPDGDIDLTVLKVPIVEGSLVHKVLAVLQKEGLKNSEYQVKDSQIIDAEVKIVKFIMRDFVVDISFNQLGGLSTLCFLEQIDHIIGKNHLFKRSIILVKVWCYHESRILGAPHGLISTYALEILVLYIFHLFHSSLRGPFSVLYKFLEYYSRFDWDNYCINLKGPADISSLPNIVVEFPESGWDDLMLSKEFLKNCMDMFSVPSKGLEKNLKKIQTKHLNIIDPLNQSNNLGRSICKGNFYRVRSVFKYGAGKLRNVLLQTGDKVSDELGVFFANTLARHDCQRRTLNLLANLNGDYDSNIRSLRYGQFCHGFNLSAPELNIHPTSPSVIEQIPQMNSRTISTVDPHPLPANGFHFEAKQMARGPCMDGNYMKKQSSKGRSENGKPGSHKQYHRVGNSDGQVSNEVNNMEILKREVPLTGNTGGSKWDQNGGEQPSKIEFGSVGNLVQELCNGRRGSNPPEAANIDETQQEEKRSRRFIAHQE